MAGCQNPHPRLYTSGRVYDNTYDVYQVNNLWSWPVFVFSLPVFLPHFQWLVLPFDQPQHSCVRVLCLVYISRRYCAHAHDISSLSNCQSPRSHFVVLFLLSFQPACAVQPASRISNKSQADTVLSALFPLQAVGFLASELASWVGPASNMVVSRATTPARHGSPMRGTTPGRGMISAGTSEDMRSTAKNAMANESRPRLLGGTATIFPPPTPKVTVRSSLLPLFHNHFP